MIPIIDADILKAPENIIVHQVNCQGVMGAGLAFQIRNKYPIVYKNYKSVVKSASPLSDLLGQVIFESVGEKKIVASMFAQEYFGPGFQTDYTYLEKCLLTVMGFAIKNNYTIAIPHKLGCGLAGGDWQKVYNIIHNMFDGCPVYIYRWHPDG
jgi:O-acetyl-ADP-ribose deacetylase (regulator of RNase III)